MNALRRSLAARRFGKEEIAKNNLNFETLIKKREDLINDFDKLTDKTEENVKFIIDEFEKLNKEDDAETTKKLLEIKCNFEVEQKKFNSEIEISDQEIDIFLKNLVSDNVLVEYKG